MSETKGIYWTDCRVKLSALKPWAENPRMSTKAQARRILASFEKFGQVQPVAIGPEDEVYDGHQRLSALFTIHGGDYAIDARRASRALSDTERRELVLALHNATGGWNWDSLSGWNTEQLSGWGFDNETLKQWNNDALNLREFMGADESVEFDSFDGAGDGGGSQFANGDKLRVVVGAVMFDIEDDDHTLYAAAKTIGEKGLRELLAEALNAV